MTKPPTGLEIEVRGAATAEEVAAVLEVLLGRRSGGPADGADRYERWRRGRLTALATDPTSFD